MIAPKTNFRLFSIAAISGLAIYGCTDNKGSRKVQEPVSAKSDGGSKEEAESSSLSGERRFLTNSLTNNGLTSKAVDRAKAAEFGAQHGPGKSKDINSLAASVAAHRLAGHSTNEAMADARAIADLEIAKNIDREIPELVQLELALTGVQSGKLTFAEFWLDKLIKSKNANIKASALNAKGVVAVKVERIPEAMVFFKEALAASADYKPALLNIGFLALQGGDAGTARKALGGMQDDWYVQSGLISVLRLEGDADKADALCDAILGQRPKHKPTLINCGINAWQGKRDFKKGRDYLNKALAVAGGMAVWDEKSGKLLGAIDADEARVTQSKALKEAEAAKAKAEANKPKEGSEQPAAQGGASGSAPAQTPPASIPK
jgi:tetratricopeptide (TPR) repeat protein